MRGFSTKAAELAEMISTGSSFGQLAHSNDDGRWRAMFDILPAAIYVTDAEGRLTYFNSAAVEFSGRTPELGTDRWCVTWKLYYPDGTPMPHGQCPMAMAIKEGRIIRGAEAIAERPDGTRVWFEPYPAPLRDEAGNIVGGINLLVDITQRKTAEETRSRLAAIVEASDDAIISIDLNAIITSWNGGAQRLFGYSAKEAVGQSVTMLIPPDRFNEEPEILARIGLGERIDHYETVRRRKDGTLLDISLTVSPVPDARGSIVGASKVARDITARKQAEEALRRAKEQAEAANRAKDHFLAALSHELRTPLTAVRMAATALDMNAELPPALRDDVRLIRRNVDMEGVLIDDLLDLSRISSGKLRLHFERLDINELIRQVCQTCSANVFEKGIRLHSDLDENAHEVSGDPARLQQVFWNLLNNAAKFTPQGGNIYIKTENMGEDGDISVRVIVRDTGKGIAPEILGRIFDAFEQGEASTTRQFGGLGLGLAICKTLVEQHHGTICAQSDGPDKGATFIVELPALSCEQLAASSPEQTGAGKDAGVGPLRLMVVEDHADTAFMLSRLLRGLGHTVQTATSAAAALKLAGEEAFDVIISDLGLPDMTGYALMKQIRGRHAIKGIAMSGYGMEEDIQKGQEAGFSDHLVKPVNLAQLEQSIQRVAGLRRTSNDHVAATDARV
jgi:PAS domain S-box-containing protein